MRKEKRINSYSADFAVWSVPFQIGGFVCKLISTVQSKHLRNKNTKFTVSII